MQDEEEEKGMTTWKREGKGADIRYPTSLAYLTLLQSPLFRERLRDPIFAKDIERIGARHHETWYVLPFFFLLSFFFLSLLPPYLNSTLIHRDSSFGCLCDVNRTSGDKCETEK
jgi:hypothetical protein